MNNLNSKERFDKIRINDIVKMRVHRKNDRISIEKAHDRSICTYFIVLVINLSFFGPFKTGQKRLTFSILQTQGDSLVN